VRMLVMMSKAQRDEMSRRGCEYAMREFGA